jgi:hypothetical protein
MPPGVLWVSSRTQTDELPAEKFCAWYENIHIPEVLALPGIPSAARYEAHPNSPGTYTRNTLFVASYIRSCPKLEEQHIIRLDRG